MQRGSNWFLTLKTVNFISIANAKAKVKTAKWRLYLLFTLIIGLPQAALVFRLAKKKIAFS
jgi:hypothetical protein